MLAAFLLSAPVPQTFAHGAYHDLLAGIDGRLAGAPDDGGLWFERAGVNLGHQEWMLAMRDLQKVETLAPGRFPTQWLKGQALDQGGKPDLAKVELDAFILVHPAHDGALASRGRVLGKLGKADAALADFRAVLSHNPEADPLLAVEIAGALMASNCNGEAADLLDSCVGRCGENTTLLASSLEADLQAKRWDEALRRVDSLQGSAPRPETWMAKRAEILALAGRAAEARAAWIALKDHLAVLPNLERGNPVMVQLGEAADKAVIGLSVNAGGDFGEELELADFHLAEKPGDASLWYLRSTLAIRNGNWQRAISDAEKSEQLAPGKFPTRAVVARALAETGKRDDALALLETEIARHPAQPEARMVRARLRAGAGEHALAIIDYRVAIRNDAAPGPGLFLEVIDCLRTLDLLSEAAELARNSIIKCGKDPSLLSDVLEIDIARRDFDAALLRVADLEKISPRPERWMARRAGLLGVAGRSAESRAAWAALRVRIAALPNLERGDPELSAIATEADHHLALAAATSLSH